MARDDRVHLDVPFFEGREVVVTAKMDGENTTILSSGETYARSPNPRRVPWRSRIKALAARVGRDLPGGWRICGEDVSIRHSIPYNHLPAHFLVFSIWTAENVALAWDETKTWAEMLDLTTVPELYVGPWDESFVRDCIHKPMLNGDPCEGYVVRLADVIRYEEFEISFAKYVRAGHVQTDAHWTEGPFVVNGLA